MKKIAATLAALLVLGIGGAVAFVYSGVYNVAATEQHTALFFWLLDKTAARSIAVRADDITPPDLGDPALARRGLSLYQDHCLHCHGAPGVAPDRLAMGMTPVPPSLLSAAREWPARNVFWTIRHGIKMSGMPAWKFQLEDGDIWAVTAFVMSLPHLAPRTYEKMVAEVDRTPPTRATAPANGPPDRQRGKQALSQYGCTGCHQIAGIVGPDIRVGPPLRNVAAQKYIAGVLPNTRPNLIRWIQAPQQIAPLSAMPDMGVTPRDAADMAAYLTAPD